MSADHDEWSAEREFAAMARRVRRTAEEEIAEIEWETDRAEQKRQDLTARSMQAMMEGERWRLQLGARSVEGIVVHGGQNFTGLQDRHGTLYDVTHAAIRTIHVVERDGALGRAPVTLRPATFFARLLGLESMRPLELFGVDGAWTCHGIIESVNSDHLVMNDAVGGETIISLNAIAWLVRRPLDERRSRPRPDR
ncbi:MAG: hypothetical protein AAF467_03520 [Actinomycetota bacterium]